MEGIKAIGNESRHFLTVFVGLSKNYERPQSFVQLSTNYSPK